MNIMLWVVQVALTLLFLAAGTTKALRYRDARRQMAWVRDLPEGLTRFIGVAEVLGGVGLIIPAVTGILPWLTPLAAAGLAAIQGLAFLFHSSRQEWRNAAANVPLGALAVFAAVGRFLLVKS